ncbi:MAG: hypothetical protein Kow0069_23000 [Promethearchaeota archaeon]
MCAKKKPAKKSSKKPVKKTAKPASDAPPAEFRKLVEVDFWATSMHGEEIGVHQTLKYVAKSRGRFTEEMDVLGVVKIEGEEDQMFAIREDFWKEEVPKRHLLIRWFKGENAQLHVGTIENMFVASVRKSISANYDLVEFRCVLPGYKYIPTISQEHTKVTKLGQNFAFELMMPDKSWRVFEFDEERLTVGSDWEVKDQTGRVVAKIDEKKFNIGGKFEVEFLDEELFENKEFFRVVILFAMTLKYKEDLRKDVKKARKLLRKGEMKLQPINTQERSLMKNPRMVGR